MAMNVPMKAILALEDGRTFEGEAFGHTGTTTGEACFNTSMTGYQEIITDPSYRGQIVAMTYPMIGNYGVSPEDAESSQPHIRGLVIGVTKYIHRAICRTACGVMDDDILGCVAR